MTGRDYLVLWTHDEAINDEGVVITRSVGTHTRGLSRGDRMFMVAYEGDELHFLGAVRVEQTGIDQGSGKPEASGANLTGPFRIIPLGDLQWKLRFEQTASPKLDKQKDLWWQVRSRRKLSPDSAQLLFDLLSQKQKRIERNIKFQDGRVWVGMMSRRERGIRKAALKARGTRCEACPFDFTERYGDWAEKCVHVHHLDGLAAAPREGRKTTKDDVRVVCPNCHAAIHRSDDPSDWEAFLRIVKKMAKR